MCWSRRFSDLELPAGQAISELTLLTLPNDLDINLHVNNGRYLTLCDLNRVDFFIRTGLARVMLARGWVPIVAEHTMQLSQTPWRLQEIQSDDAIDALG